MKESKRKQMDELAKREAKRIKEQIRAEHKFDRELQSCMRCKYFFGNSAQCIKNKCDKHEMRKPKEHINNYCKDCPYKKEGKYCFPCMKKLLGG